MIACLQLQYVLRNYRPQEEQNWMANPPNALAKRTGQTHWPNALPNALAKRTGQTHCQTHWPNALVN